VACSKCGKAKIRQGGKLFTTVSDAEKFISLVDNGATTKSYNRELGLSSEQIGFHLNYLGIYRRTVIVFAKMKELMKTWRDNYTADEYGNRINHLRNLMWKDGPLDEIQYTRKNNK
jgi:hypothetical protein